VDFDLWIAERFVCVSPEFGLLELSVVDPEAVQYPGISKESCDG